MRTRTKVTGIGLAAAAVALSAAPASAHVTIREPEHAAGEYTVLTFQNGHGCEGSPTTTVEIQIPESIVDVTPTRHAFYDVAVETEALPEPVEGSHGEQITERESVVVYTATEPLEDGYRDAFEISMQIPDDLAGETVYFPVIQTCAEGETAWIEIPDEGEDPHSLEAPAPSITVVEGGGGHGHDGASSDGAEEPEVEAEEVLTEDEAVDGELAAAESDDGTDGLTIVALVVGILGLLAGAAGFVTARKATS